MYINCFDNFSEPHGGMHCGCPKMALCYPWKGWIPTLPAIKNRYSVWPPSGSKTKYLHVIFWNDKHCKLLAVTIHAYLPILVNRTSILPLWSHCRVVPRDDRYLQLLRWHWTTRLIEDWKLIALHSRPQTQKKGKARPRQPLEGKS